MRTQHRLRVLAPALFVVASLPAVTLELRAQPPALPSPVGYVNDFAGVIPADAKSRLENLAQRLNSATRGDMVVVTLPDLGGRPVEEVALRLGREWKIGADAKIGEQARNAGVVILVVPKETADDGRGRCRIETGQGTEGFITDATSGSLCRAATPLFQARDYGGAIEYLAGSIAERYAAEFGVTLDGQPRAAQRSSRGSDDFSRLVPILIFLAIFVVLPMMGRRRRGCVGCLPIPFPMPGSRGGFGGYSGGGFGGGFGGGGGGGFGGFGGGGGFSGGGGGSDW